MVLREYSAPPPNGVLLDVYRDRGDRVVVIEPGASVELLPMDERRGLPPQWGITVAVYSPAVDAVAYVNVSRGHTCFARPVPQVNHNGIQKGGGKGRGPYGR